MNKACGLIPSQQWKPLNPEALHPESPKPSNPKPSKDTQERSALKPQTLNSQTATGLYFLSISASAVILWYMGWVRVRIYRA